MNDIFGGKEICTLGYYDPECWSGVAPPCLLAISDTALLPKILSTTSGLLIATI